ncbi:MAG: ABC transporter permease [Deltaproteobacteria bacterium]|nr:ABC transporter permease [Deltaproteobacteria bacterium]
MQHRRNPNYPDGRFRRRYPGVIIGFSILAVIVLLALLGPWVYPCSPWEYVGRPLAPPSWAHPLGTNDVGQDLLSELIYGARTSLGIGFAVGLVGTLVSLMVALSSVLKGGRFDFVLMRLVDAWLTIPPLLLVMLLVAFVPPKVSVLILALSLFSWAGGARIFRAQALELRSELYVEAAVAMGASGPYLVRRHFLPGLYHLIILNFLVLTRRAVLLESSLAFLGLADPQHKSWGMMLQYGMKFMALGDLWVRWLLPPALALGLTLISLALIGFGLERRFEPTLRT